MELTYRQEGDYLVPNIEPENTPEDMELTKFGFLRKKFLEEHKRTLYTQMRLKGTYFHHLLQIQEEADTMWNRLIEEQAKALGVNEELKMNDQMKWVGMMNNIRASAEEIVLNELIYN